MRLFLLILCSFAICAADFTPRHLYLTLDDDGAHSVTVSCQELPPSGAGWDKMTAAEVRFDVMPHADAASFPQHVVGTMHQIMGLADGRAIHHIRLVDLQPATTYHAVVGWPDRWSKPFSFRTLPADDRPLSFITGGDIGPFPVVGPMTAAAAKRDPAFVCLGGDLFYENGQVARVDVVDDTLDRLLPNLTAPDGRLIPMILAMGNHDAQLPGWGKTPRDAPFFFGFFPQGPLGFFRRALGSSAVLYVLDSGHATPIAGEQTAWLENRLKLDEDRRWKFALYHVPFYPSCREYDPNYEALRLWGPLFDQAHLTAAFENHDHSFKRTFPLRNRSADPAGTLYLGDGCWGQKPRPVDRNRPYLTRAASVNHLWEVRITKKRVEYRAFLADGTEFDAYPEDLPGAAARQAAYDRLPVK